MREIEINTPYIKLGQFLKYAQLVEKGSDEKIYLLTKEIYVNGEKENRRGRKIYPNDVVKVEKEEFLIKCL